MRQDHNKQEEIAVKIEAAVKQSVSHQWKNRFHIEMPFGLINDPNGLSWFNGAYHIFFQWNPYGCEHKTKHWGLVKTSDFVHYSRPEIVLKPEAWYDKNGCYSGCGKAKNGILQLYYTGNVKNDHGERASYQCLAEYLPDGTVLKKGVLVESQPKGYTSHFRDPYLLTVNGIDYMLLGAQTENLKGGVLLYRQEETGWCLVGELKTSLGNFGYMWECPNLIKVAEDLYAFIFSPQGLGSEEFRYQNLYQSGYVLGQVDLAIPSLEHGAFRELDRGFDFYAPQIFAHEGRNIMIGWIGMPDRESDCPAAGAGWMYALTLPRQIVFKNGRLYQTPLKELENLRDVEMIKIQNTLAAAYHLPMLSRCAEIELEIELLQSQNMEIKFAFHEEFITLSYDRSSQIACLDRSTMRLGGQGQRKFKLTAKERLSLRIYIDSSVMEVYFQDGEEVATLMYFPQESNRVETKISADNVLNIKKLHIWKLKEISYI